MFGDRGENNVKKQWILTKLLYEDLDRNQSKDFIFLKEALAKKIDKVNGLVGILI